MWMIVIGLGAFGVYMFMRKRRYAQGSEARHMKRRDSVTQYNSMSQLFADRLIGGAAGVVDQMRKLEAEGNTRATIMAALSDAVSKNPTYSATGPERIRDWSKAAGWG
jgi:hypothetical protein